MIDYKSKKDTVASTGALYFALGVWVSILICLALAGFISMLAGC